MRDPRPPRLVDQRERLRHAVVQHRGAEAAADDEQAQCAGPPGEALGRLGQALDLGPHRIAGDDRVAGPARRFAVEPERDAFGERQQRAVAQQQRGVGVDQHQRLAQQPRGDAARERQVAAHRQHRIGMAPAQDREAAPERTEQLDDAGDAVQQALAAQPGERHRVHRDAGRRHQPVLHAVRGAEPAHAPAARPHLLGDREPRNHVAAGTGRDDHQMARRCLEARLDVRHRRPPCASATAGATRHARPPRMSPLAAARALRALHTAARCEPAPKQHPARIPRAAPFGRARTSLMRGLRA